MPTANSSLHTRALRRAFAHESIPLAWGEVEFSAVKNPVRAEADRTDPNSGDDTACTLTAVVTADPAVLDALRPNNMPGQGAIFTDDLGNTYRVAARDWTPGLPAAVFHIPNVVTP